MHRRWLNVQATIPVTSKYILQGQCACSFVDNILDRVSFPWSLAACGRHPCWLPCVQWIPAGPWASGAHPERVAGGCREGWQCDWVKTKKTATTQGFFMHRLFHWTRETTFPTSTFDANFGVAIGCKGMSNVPPMVSFWSQALPRWLQKKRLAARV